MSIANIIRIENFRVGAMNDLEIGFPMCVWFLLVFKGVLGTGAV